MKVIEGVNEMRSFSSSLRAGGKRIAFVPTMGFLHDGHKRLLDVGRKLGDVLVLSIFVNPAQFGPREDLKTYPRDLDRDLKVAEEAGVDIVFTPGAQDIYPPGYKTYVEVEGLSGVLCGESRPGHFRGVATVVLKLFNIVGPHAAIFGRKDFQQLRIIEKMTEDLNLPVEIVGVETVREPDGLSMSSRNSYLNETERAAARSIPKAMRAAAEEAQKGAAPAAIIEKVKKIIEKEPLAVVDYVKVCRAGTLEELETLDEGAMLFLAVRIGRARLIDNCILKHKTYEKFLDRT